MFPPRRLGVGLAAVGLAAALAAAVLAAAALATAEPALAQTIAAPAGDAGLWGALNGWLAPALATVATGAIAWAAKGVTSLTKVKVTTELEDQIRQTALTGIYQAAHGLEVKIDGSITPQQRAQLISQGVAWVMQRMPGPIGKLGFGTSVISAIVTKMLGQAIGANPVLDLGDVALSGADPAAAPDLAARSDKHGGR